MKLASSKSRAIPSQSIPVVKGGCPNCDGGNIVEGKLLGQLDLGGGLAFRPKGRGLLGWLFRPDLRVKHPVFACADCGLMWTFVNSKPLKRMMPRD